MPPQNALEIKEKILWVLRRRGPSLPVHIAKETGLSILFASAFLSEIVADKKIKFTNMKVGSSPIYFLNDHAYMLERFSQHLNSREKEAFILLRERKFLADREQTPVIRVALRAIKDFAMPFGHGGEIIWRYYTAPESEFKPELREKAPELKSIEKNVEKVIEKLAETKPMEKPIEIRAEKPKEKEARKELQKELDIFDKTEKLKKEKRRPKKESKKRAAKINDNFFNKAKEWVSKNSMEIIDIESFSKNELMLRAKKDGAELIIAAYNKKRITDSDLIKANKKAKDLGLSYMLISMGEPQRKINDLVDAAKNLSGMKKME